MNKLTKIFATVVIGSMLLQSCSDFLDTSPSSGVNEKDAITNEENATAALIGTYEAFAHYYHYGRDFVINGEVPTSNSELTPTNSSKFIPLLSWSFTKSTTEIENYWNKSYDAINRANKIINATISGDDEIVNSIKGEAYALRAIAHFDLVRFYAQNYNFTTDHSHLGIPYIFVYNPKGKPGRNSVGEVYTNIVADLKKAKELGVNKFTRKEPPFTLSDGAINALLSKVYLYMDDYAKAKTYAELVIPNYTLESHDNYIAAWKETKLTESIFTMSITQLTYGGVNSLGYILAESGYGDIIVNKDLLGLYADDDVRKSWFVKGTESTTKDRTYITGKYPGRSGITGVDNFNVIRLSEVYLIAAEASARIGDEASAQQYLNAIRQRAIPTAPAVTSTGQTLIDEILLEKRKELAFEGNYYHDLKRLQQDVTGADIGQATPKVITYPSDLFAWPIPESETNANPTIAAQQNPGY